MRTCQSCGKENPDDQDFCSCGEYLRWEPTGYGMPAITPDQIEPKPAAPAAPASPPVVTPAEPITPEPGNGHGNGHSLPAVPPPPPPTPLPAVPPSGDLRPVAKTMVRNLPAVPAPANVPGPPPPRSPGPPVTDRRDELPSEPATIVLRADEKGDYAKGGVLEQTVEPGERTTLRALIRNQSGIVDNYDLRVEGLPDDWWSIFPGTVYLVPFGAGGTYEQEVEIHLHPPRGPEAESRLWELKVTADSKASRIVAASAPLHLHIGEYIETATALRPQRRRGRRKVEYDVTVINKANAPVLVALDGEDTDGELEFGFNRPPQEIPAGGSVTTQMQVKAPKRIWIGRVKDRQLSIETITGDEATTRAAAAPLPASVLEGVDTEPPKKKWYRRRPKTPRIPGMYPPRIYKPMLYPPDVNFGPGGIQVRMPQMRGPQMHGPQMGGASARALGMPGSGQLKMPSRSGNKISGPLAPSQGVFRQRPLIPWWSLLVLALLLLLLFLLFRSLPDNVVVPKVTGTESAFVAEETLTKSDLKLDPSQKTKVDDSKAAGSVIDQTPKAGEEVKKGSTVTVLIAVKSGKVNVPDVANKTASEADKALREKQLTLGQASPSDAAPEAKISSQIPAPNEVVSAGTPVQIFFEDPTSAEEREKKGDKDGKAGVGGAGGGGAGGGGGGDITVPAIGGDDVDKYAKKAADLGIVPKTSQRFDDAPLGRLIAVVPEPGTKVKAGAKVTLVQSAGQPQVVFTNGKDILRVNGANGKKLEPVADGDEEETNPTWNAAGTHVAYIADGRIMLKDITKDNADAVPLTPAGSDDSNLAWAPIADRNVLAFTRATDTDVDLCLGKINQNGLDASCIPDPSFSPNRVVHWAPDGKSILAFAGKNDQSEIGIVRWKLKQGRDAFSSDAGDWSKGRFVSDVSRPSKFMLDATISPDGKQIAMISNQGVSRFTLFLGETKNGFDLKKAKKTTVRACKVVWRSDGRELLVIQADAGCVEEVGTLARVPVDATREPETLNASGNDPVYQPLSLEG
ncbi:PASTA domain-containing protein [Solirubrobacter phytolaccae]|uniref:PASTA domain-containing protein n=1 Tax=Solirubrobacter phytolaccae TaxID=1404360 RepID=A0A9X3SBI5_9ACTN|nr:PASTA domain-containing protein [Solirubrobacter phytolaccae]MDA0185599.1 PASTA domain-containing protein [Solirubrobacter phytolaccae]